MTMIGTWLGVALGVFAIAFAVYQWREALHERAKRVNMENAVREHLARLSGSISVMYENANWSDVHYRNIGANLSDDVPNLVIVKRQAFDGARDAAACARQLSIVHTYLRGIQKSLFKEATDDILPEILADDVKAAQNRTTTNKTMNAVAQQ
jgi:hypothetical protein